jgi:hypothetical protein
VDNSLSRKGLQLDTKLDTMPDMATKPPDRHAAEQLNLRLPPEYAWIITALDKLAAEVERSRNMATIMLLRDVLIARGFTPPEPKRKPRN